MLKTEIKLSPCAGKQPRSETDNKLHTSTMCPTIPASTVGANVEPPIEYFNWLETARCVLSLLYQHQTDTFKTLCYNCHTRIISSEQILYSLKFRHYIYIGSPTELDKCATCNISLTNTRHTNDCDVCRNELPHFLNYIETIGETPYLNDGATIVAITQISL